MKRFLVFGCLFLFLLALAAAQSVDSEQQAAEIRGGVSSFYDRALENSFVQGVGNFLGFGDQEGGGYFYTGLLAGLWIWIVYFVVRVIRHFGGEDNPAKKEDASLREKEWRWVSFIAGRIWKIVFIAVFYWILIHIPVVNRVIQFVTFETFGLTGSFENNVARSVWIAVLIGFLPQIIQKIRRKRLELGYRRRASAVPAT